MADPRRLYKFKKAKETFLKQESKKDKIFCALCGEEIKRGTPLDINFQLEVDHIIAPRVDDEKDSLWYEISNFQSTHKLCNSFKRRKLLTEKERSRIKANYEIYVERKKKESKLFDAVLQDFDLQIPKKKFYNSGTTF